MQPGQALSSNLVTARLDASRLPTIAAVPDIAPGRAFGGTGLDTYLGRPSFMPLFVALKPGVTLDQALVERIRQQIRTKASGRHVPDAVVQVSEIPHTLTGTKMEVPVRKLLLGADPGKVASPDAMQNPGSLDFFVEYAKTIERPE